MKVLRSIAFMLLLCPLVFYGQTKEEYYGSKLKERNLNKIQAFINQGNYHLLYAISKDHIGVNKLVEILNANKKHDIHVSINKTQRGLSLLNFQIDEKEINSNIQIQFDGEGNVTELSLENDSELINSLQSGTREENYNDPVTVKLSQKRSMSGIGSVPQEVRLSNYNNAQYLSPVSEVIDQVNQQNVIKVQSFPSVNLTWKSKFGTTHNRSYNFNQVISNSDVPTDVKPHFYKNTPFGTINDATNYISTFTYWGNQVPYGAAFVLERKQKRIGIFNYGKEISYTTEGLCDPVAIKVIGDFLYALDKCEKKVVMFKIVPDVASQPENVHLEYKGKTDFGVSLSNPTDIGGIALDGYHMQMVIADGSKYHKFHVKGVNYNNSQNNYTYGIEAIDFNDQYWGYSQVSAVTNPYNLNEVVPFGEIKKIDVCGVTGSSAGEIAIITEKNEFITTPSAKIISGAYQTENWKPIYSFHTNMNLTNSELTNLAYNLNNDSWYVSDNFGMLHTFSAEGKYISTDGSHGTSENSDQLYHPVAVSENNKTFKDEFVVVNEWGENTGMKQFKSEFDRHNQGVVERNGSVNDRLYFRYSYSGTLSSPRSLTLKVNGNTFFSTSNYNFNTPNVILEQSLLESSYDQYGIKTGWNSYTVYMDGVGETIYFFLLTDEISVQGDSKTYLSSNDFNHTQEPLYIYKDINIKKNTSIEAKLHGGQTVLLPNVQITIDGEAEFDIENEEFLLYNNAHILFNDYNKSRWIKHCAFDGMGLNNDLVSFLWADNGNGNYNNSVVLQQCEFKGYKGNAVTAKNEFYLWLSECEFNASSITNSKAVEAEEINLFFSFGSTFKNNGIGISTNLVSTFDLQYSNVNGKPNLFENNDVGVYNFSTEMKSNRSEFRNNKTGIQSTTSTVRLDNDNTGGGLRTNYFVNNEMAILFSGDLVMANGKNSFYGNDVEIGYIPEVQFQFNMFTWSWVLVPVGNSFDWECNHWVHTSGTSSQPIFEVVLPPFIPYNPADFVFVYQPTYFPLTGQCGGGGSSALTFSSPTPISTVSGSSAYTAYNQGVEQMSQEDYAGAQTSLDDATSLVISSYANINSTAKQEVSSMYRAKLSNSKILYAQESMQRSDDHGNVKQLIKEYEAFIPEQNEDFVVQYFVQYIDALITVGEYEKAFNQISEFIQQIDFETQLIEYQNNANLVNQYYARNMLLGLLAQVEAHGSLERSSIREAILSKIATSNKSKELKSRDIYKSAAAILNEIQTEDQLTFNRLLKSQKKLTYQEDDPSLNDENLQVESASIYPNPLSGVSTLTLDIANEGVYDLTIYNALGQKAAIVFQNKMLSSQILNQEINTDEYKLSEGVYFIELTAQDGARVFNQQIVIH